VPNLEAKIGLKGKQVKALHGPATVMVSSLHYATAWHFLGEYWSWVGRRKE